MCGIHPKWFHVNEGGRRRMKQIIQEIQLTSRKTLQSF